jgi:hypothetical protein
MKTTQWNTKYKKKTEAAYQTILMVAGDKDFRNIEMGTLWKLIETCIIPIITYGAETWNLKKQEKTELNKILDQIIKRILKVPITTPRETLYMETGLLDIDTITKRKRLTMEERLRKTATELIKNTIASDQKGGWNQKTHKTMEDVNINKQEFDEPKGNLTHLIRSKTKEYLKEKLEREGKRKSKVNYLMEGTKTWEAGKRREYMDKQEAL